jgi:cytochrome c-type biogenesis protein CcmE
MRRPARSLALGGAIILAALGFLIYQGISNNLVYYITPSELLAKGAAANGQSFRLGGQVRPHSVRWNPYTKVVSFVLQDPKRSVRVVSQGQPPALFREGIGCVVEGTFAHGTFTATTVMVKHSGTYVAPKPGDTPVPDNFKPST